MRYYFGPQGFRNASWVDRGEIDTKTGKELSGICKNCNEWSAELKNGACKDRECIQTQLNNKVEAGEAIRLQTDVIGNNGKVGTFFEQGKKKFFVEKK